jgi:hypothetical protein
MELESVGNGKKALNSLLVFEHLIGITYTVNHQILHSRDFDQGELARFRAVNVFEFLFEVNFHISTLLEPLCRNALLAIGDFYPTQALGVERWRRK